MQVVKQSKQALALAIKIINSGGIVVCPTDTVYGFLADAANKKAVNKIFKIKKRPKTKPLAIFVKDIKMAKELAEINEAQEEILKKYWPGKFTFILELKASSLRGTAVTKQSKIAIRIPKYKFLNDLLKKLDKPLVQTSVNISGEPSLIKINDIIEKFGRLNIPILIIDAGDLKRGKPSKVVDLTGQVLTRLR